MVYIRQARGNSCPIRKGVIEIDLNFALSIEWLQKAIVLDTSWIGTSKTDSDFDNIRRSSEFQQLIQNI